MELSRSVDLHSIFNMIEFYCAWCCAGCEINISILKIDFADIFAQSRGMVSIFDLFVCSESF